LQQELCTTRNRIRNSALLIFAHANFVLPALESGQFVYSLKIAVSEHFWDWCVGASRYPRICHPPETDMVHHCGENARCQICGDRRQRTRKNPTCAFAFSARLDQMLAIALPLEYLHSHGIVMTVGLGHKALSQEGAAQPLHLGAGLSIHNLCVIRD
jgi:hypothetical protein